MRIIRTIAFSLLILAVGTALAAAAGSPQARTIKLKVTAEQANLREKPDIGSSVMQAIPEGTLLDADKKEGEWYFVRYTLEDGGVIGGWIHESLVEVVGQGEPISPPAAQPPAKTPAREPAARQPRTGGIKMPEFRTGTIPLEFAVSMGVATLAPRDLNDGTRGFADWAAASAGLTVPDRPDILNLAGLMGFELAYRFSTQLTFGVGADLLTGSNGSAVKLGGGDASETVRTKPYVRAVPFKLMVRFYPGSGFYLRGGFGIYSAKAGYFYRNESADAWEQWKGSASTSGLGFEGAFGGEWDIAPRTVLFVEAGMRIASFSGLTGQDQHRSSAGDNTTEAGTLFFFHKTAGGAEDYPLIVVRPSAPAEEGVVDARRARINLSGTAVRVGVRYKF